MGPAWRYCPNSRLAPTFCLDVIDEENASTVWDEPFATDHEALDAVMEVIEQDGIRSFLDGEPEEMH